jgi:NitT/TauT family transport system permease protein/putative hydroxymethylpyrimidine transport system permease protein
VIAALLLLAFVGVWQLYAGPQGDQDLILAAPTEIATALWEDRALLWDNLLVTAQEVVLGLALALVAGVAAATAIHLWEPLRRALLPLLAASQAVPIVVIAPLLVLWFGFELTPKVVIVALVTFFPITVNALDGLDSVDPDMRKLLRTLGASRWRALRLVEGPGALPALLSGTKIAVAVAVIGAVLAEDAGATQGLGLLITQANSQLDTPRAYAAVVVLALFAMALFAALTLAERRLAPWAERARNRQGARLT